jgi:hypothetical protein
MTRVIYKVILYPGSTTVNLHENAKPLFVHEQRNDIVLWYECDPFKGLTPRPVSVVPTGVEVPRDLPYLGTVLLRSGSIVFHVFI